MSIAIEEDSILGRPEICAELGKIIPAEMQPSLTLDANRLSRNGSNACDEATMDESLRNYIVRTTQEASAAEKHTH